MSKQPYGPNWRLYGRVWRYVGPPETEDAFDEAEREHRAHVRAVNADRIRVRGIKHGTQNGAWSHRLIDEAPCSACKLARAAYLREKRASRKAVAA